MITLDVIPVPKPRMTRSDRWKQRKCVVDYWQFKDLLKLEMSKHIINYKLPEKLAIDFYIPMPKSWSEKKRYIMNGKPHLAKPDADNLMKAFKDCLAGEKGDSHVWDEHTRKFWGFVGKIIIK